MENKINIAELLKDCPKDMELDCTMYENVYFNKIYDEDCLYQIGCYTINNGVRNSINFTKYGEFNTMRIAKCVIFPKGKTTWEGFIPPCQFKDGDIVAFDTEKGAQLFIFKEYIHNNDYAKCVKCYMMLDCGGEIDFESDGYYVERLATEEEKEKLFQAIKDNGYKWNAETKTLEKLVEPKFKVGDRITDKNKFIYRITEVTDKGYKLHNLKPTFITFEEADLYFVKVVDVFDITTLKPFDKVLVRQNVDGKWGIDFFGFYIEGYYYTTGSSIYVQCIPYEGNEHLLETNNDCDEFYKTWK